MSCRGEKGQARPQFWGSSKPAASQPLSLATPASSTSPSGRAKQTVCEQLKHSNSVATFKHTRVGSCAGTAGQPTGPAAIWCYWPTTRQWAAKLQLSEVSRMSSPDQVYLSDPALQVQRLPSPRSSSARLPASPIHRWHRLQIYSKGQISKASGGHQFKTI